MRPSTGKDFREDFGKRGKQRLWVSIGYERVGDRKTMWKYRPKEVL